MSERTGGRPLTGRRVGILQTRYGREVANLIEREGGTAVLAPTLREIRVDELDDLQRQLVEIAGQPIDLAVFQTGVGVAALFDLADQLGLGEVLAQRLAAATVVARGPKPLAALLKRGLRVDLRTGEPHTTAEVETLLCSVDLAGLRVALQHHGGPNQELVGYLRGRGAEVIELAPYHWALPDDLGPIHTFLQELAAGHIDVTAFTSAAQVGNLFAVAERVGCVSDLPGWLNERTRVAAIGPACAKALAEHRIAVSIRPARPKMVPFVRSISEAFQG